MFGGLRIKLQYPGRFFRPDTPAGATAYYHAMRLLYRREAAQRARMAPPASFTVPEHAGYAVHSFAPDSPLMAAVEHARQEAAKVDWRAMERTAKKPFLLQHPIPVAPPIKAAVHSLLGPVSAYLGGLPVLAAVQIWHSPNRMDAGRSQLFHMDAEDRRQLKCFLPLWDIDRDSGPFTIIPADRTRGIYADLVQAGETSTRAHKISDEIMAKYAIAGDIVPLTGPVGAIMFADTSRCYHYGSRPAPKPRLLLALHFLSAFSIESPLFRSPPPIHAGWEGFVLGPQPRLFPVVRARLQGRNPG
jgi:hypothetical protein